MAARTLESRFERMSVHDENDTAPYQKAKDKTKVRCPRCPSPPLPPGPLTDSEGHRLSSALPK